MKMNDLKIPGKFLSSFILTQEFKRFEEFVNSCVDYRYIGVCYGEPGVGKSLAAAYYTKWREELTSENLVSDISLENSSMAKICKGVFVTVPVTNTPKTIRYEIHRRYFGYGSSVAKANGITDLEVRVKYANSFCPLVILDESDRLSFNSLEEVRNMYDYLHFGLVLIGMPGFEKRLSRYPQLFSRIGFAHQYKSLGEDEMRFVFPRIWSKMGKEYDPEYFADYEAMNTIIRITGGNFRLIDRIFSQICRIMEINKLQTVTKEVVEAARKCLLIG
ncbi:AAA family ATPase [Dyadobacter psychrotolerans]|uniref:ATP-binding protein n=1 Tax=Dyadobacter psychrotolerans TaxID=2541721 RepID=A0A4V6PFP0_9BACT|nr:AAA family ATPase [Dyadobacter psychrotolerans]TDE11008.1 ATP-binding protein [Dyadobacter psychrotolerans]